MGHRTTCITSPNKTTDYTDYADFYCRGIEGPRGSFIFRHGLTPFFAKATQGRLTKTLTGTDDGKPQTFCAFLANKFSCKAVYLC